MKTKNGNIDLKNVLIDKTTVYAMLAMMPGSGADVSIMLKPYAEVLAQDIAWNNNRQAEIVLEVALEIIHKIDPDYKPKYSSLFV